MAILCWLSLLIDTKDFPHSTHNCFSTGFFTGFGSALEVLGPGTLDAPDGGPGGPGGPGGGGAEEEDLDIDLGPGGLLAAGDGEAVLGIFAITAEV